jgi:hypothetical protein
MSQFLTLILNLISVLTYHPGFSPKAGSLPVKNKGKLYFKSKWLEYFQVILCFTPCKIPDFVAFSTVYQMGKDRILVTSTFTAKYVAVANKSTVWITILHQFTCQMSH